MAEACLHRFPSAEDGAFEAGADAFARTADEFARLVQQTLDLPLKPTERALLKPWARDLSVVDETVSLDVLLGD